METPLVLFTGSRTWTNTGIVKDVFLCLLGPQGFNRFRIVHGGARGLDQIVQELAFRFDIESETVRPDYLQYGRYDAPKRRNIRMLERKPTMVVGFWDGESGGTGHCLDFAINVYRIPTMVITQ